MESDRCKGHVFLKGLLQGNSAGEGPKRLLERGGEEGGAGGEGLVERPCRQDHRGSHDGPRFSR